MIAERTPVAGATETPSEDQRVTELSEAPSTAEGKLSEVQARYDRLANQLESMLAAEATPDNVARLQRMLNDGKGVERELAMRKANVARLRAELAEARPARALSTRAARVAGPTMTTKQLQDWVRRAARAGNRQAHRVAFVRLMKDIATRNGDPNQINRLSDEKVLALDGIGGLEEEVWTALRDPKRAAELDVILSRVASPR